MKQYQLQRKNPKTGFNETVVFTGNLKNKSKDWKLVKEIFPNTQYTGLV